MNPDKPKNKQSRIKLLTIVLLVALISFVGFAIRIFHSTPTLDDPLCNLATETFGMTCVPLASPIIYEKGAIFKRNSEESGNTNYKFPVDYILSESCFAPDEDLGFAKFVKDTSKSINFGRHSFSINKNLSIGVNLNLPQTMGSKLQAGLRISEVKSVIMEADSAQLFNIDSRKFIESINSCSAKKSCVSKADNPQNLIVKQLLVAQNLRYRIEATNGESFPLSVAINKGLVNFEGTIGGEIVSAKDLSTGKDMVFAVNFFDESLLQELNLCKNDLFTSNVEGKSFAKVFRDDILIDKKENNRDEEVDANFIYHLPEDERGVEESYSVAEAKAWGKWIYEQQTNTLTIYSRNLVIPGLRWISERDTFKENFATVRADMQNDVSLSFMNRLDEMKTLSAKMNINFNTSRVTKFFPPNQYLDLFRIETSDNKISTIPVLWNTSDNFIEFDICSIKPGETIKLNLRRILKSKALYNDSSAISEDITIKFLLIDATKHKQ
jgi:hypothetical protein